MHPADASQRTQKWLNLPIETKPDKTPPATGISSPEPTVS
jgi:hypothetical protein